MNAKAKKVMTKKFKTVKEVKWVSDKVVPVIEEKKAISSYPLESLILWRNTASARVTKDDADLQYIEKCMIELDGKWRKITKKKLNDIKWIKKLNRILENKVFNQRS